MNKRFGNADERLAAYIYDVYRPEDDELVAVREHAQAEGLPTIQVGALDGRLLEVLARASGAKLAVEVGTLGGFSGLCLLRGMGAGAVLHTLELDEHHADVARENFRRAGVADRVRVHVGPALDTLPKLAAHAPFDLVFIDADKIGYPRYLEWAEEHLRVGGTVLADNALLFGQLANAPEGESAASIVAMQQFHQRLARGGRFRATLIPTGEGLAFGVKIS